MNFYRLLGHDAPAGRYPAPVVPVLADGEQVVVSYRGRLDAIAADAEYVKDSGFRYFDPERDALFAFSEMDVVTYRVAEESEFFESLLQDKRFASADPCFRLSYALETRREDLIGPELIAAYRAIPDELRAKWYQKTLTILEAAGLDRDKWHEQEILAASRRATMPVSARTIFRPIAKLEQAFRVIVPPYYEATGLMEQPVAHLSPISTGDRLVVAHTSWLTRLRSGALDEEERLARAWLQDALVPRLLAGITQAILATSRSLAALEEARSTRQRVVRACRDHVISIVGGWHLQQGLPLGIGLNELYAQCHAAIIDGLSFGKTHDTAMLAVRVDWQDELHSFNDMAIRRTLPKIADALEHSLLFFMRGRLESNAKRALLFGSEWGPGLLEMFDEWTDTVAALDDERIFQLRKLMQTLEQLRRNIEGIR